MITKSHWKIISLGCIFLATLYFLNRYLIQGLLLGLISLIPAVVIFLGFLFLKYVLKVSKFESKPLSEILFESIGLGLAVGLITVVVVKIFFM